MKLKYLNAFSIYTAQRKVGFNFVFAWGMHICRTTKQF